VASLTSAFLKTATAQAEKSARQTASKPPSPIRPAGSDDEKADPANQGQISVGPNTRSSSSFSSIASSKGKQLTEMKEKSANAKPKTTRK
jgi:hypothetical protein